MERDGFMRDLTGLNRYMTMDERTVTIEISGVSGINRQVESGREAVKGTTKAIS